jgi:GT2 family glycosyltransferase
MEQKKVIDISFIIVSFRDKEFLEKAIKSIVDHTKDLSFEIIVVDNDHSIDLKKYITSQFENIHYILMEENKGYSYALNKGAELANGQCNCICNSDIEFSSDTIRNAYATLLTNQKIGILAPQIKLPDGSIQISWGRKPNLINEFITKIRDYLYRKNIIAHHIQQKADTGFFPAWATGACLLIKREVWEKLNGFDTQFFLYLEDSDFCLRAQQQSYKILYCPELKIIHHLGQSKLKNIKQATIEAKRSQLYFYQKQNGKFQLWLLSLYLRLKGL